MRGVREYLQPKGPSYIPISLQVAPGVSRFQTADFNFQSCSFLDVLRRLWTTESHLSGVSFLRLGVFRLPPEPAPHQAGEVDFPHPATTSASTRPMPSSMAGARHEHNWTPLEDGFGVRPALRGYCILIDAHHLVVAHHLVMIALIRMQ